VVLGSTTSRALGAKMSPMSGESLGEPVDVKRKPRALLEGLGDVIREQVEGLFPFEMHVDASDEMHDDDWDVMVTATEHAIRRSPRLFVVAFGATSVDSLQPWQLGTEPNGTLQGRADAQGLSKARDLSIPAGLPADVERLVRRDLVPGFERGQPRVPWQAKKLIPQHGYVPESDGLFLDAFLYASDGSVLAGRVRRNRSQRIKDERFGECWLLPSWVSQPREWVRAAWGTWHQADPSRIPPPPDWADSSSWYTPAEAEIALRGHAVAEKKQQVIAELEAEANAIDDEFVAARMKAEVGPRRVLTAQGDDLVAAVQQVLEDMGFEVDNMDLVFDEGDRREDLRVRDAEGYEAIAEVRGYKGGAQSNDLLRIGRFAMRYQQEKGCAPSAQWYVVNEFLNDDPGTRPTVALASKPDDVREFGENPGAVISSVTLYRLWQQVMSGLLTKEEARKLLRDCRGQFTF